MKKTFAETLRKEVESVADWESTFALVAHLNDGESVEDFIKGYINNWKRNGAIINDNYFSFLDLEDLCQYIYDIRDENNLILLKKKQYHI